MRKLFIILFLLPFVTLSQSRDTIPVKKANKIIIKNGNSARENFVLLQTILINKKYTIIINRRDFTVNTKDSLIESGSSSYIISGVAKGDSVILTGKYKARVVTSIFGQQGEIYNYDITNTGSKGTIPQRMFLLLDSIANGIKGDRFYIIEKKRRKGSIF
jgi:hypothetical protein